MNLLQAISRNRTDIQNLFEKKGLSGDLTAVRRLTPFASHVSSSFFYELLKTRNVPLCEHMMQQFDKCLLYLNYMAFPLNPTKGAISLLQELLIKSTPTERDLAFFEMLLRNGANPDVSGGSRANSYRLLTVAILMEKEAFVDLLLKYGASTTQKDKEGLDAIGRATCHPNPNIHPNLKIVRLLVKHGANINALQGTIHSQGVIHNQPTALQFACEHNDPPSAEEFIALGADPNQIMLKTLTYESNRKMCAKLFPVTPLFESVVAGADKITEFLLKQSKAPITFDNLARTCAFFFAFLDINGALGFIISPRRSLNLELSKSRDASSMGRLLSDVALRKIYDNATVTTVLKNATEEGNKCFKEKDYHGASHSFYIPLLFGNSEQRFSACYNIASCRRRMGVPEFAIYLYKICIQYNPDSQIGQNAEKLIKHIQQQKTAATQPPPNHPSRARPGR